MPPASTALARYAALLLTGWHDAYCGSALLPARNLQEPAVCRHPLGMGPDELPCVKPRRRLFTWTTAWECAVSGGVVGGVVVPAAPDDVCPGAGQDADGVGAMAARPRSEKALEPYIRQHPHATQR